MLLLRPCMQIAEVSISPQIFSIATLTGHVQRCYGDHYSGMSRVHERACARACVCVSLRWSPSLVMPPGTLFLEETINSLCMALDVTLVKPGHCVRPVSVPPVKLYA